MSAAALRLHAVPPAELDGVWRGSELARYVWAAGALYQPGFEVLPVLRLDRLGRGGDHRALVLQRLDVPARVACGDHDDPPPDRRPIEHLF